MSIVYQCIHCHRPVSAPDELAGQAWYCPHVNCSRDIRIPRWGEGQLIEGIWQITKARWRVRNIFEGGMSWVYLAQDVEAFQEGKFIQCAFKSFKDVSDPTNVQNFMREAKQWVRLGQHDHIVLALSAIDMEGWPLLQIEYVHGWTLKQWIQRRRLSLPQALNFAIQICKGMEYVSEYAQLVHRDLKPSNLLIDDLNVLKITDLGISQTVSDPKSAESRNRNHATVAGTPLYMSPEQFNTSEVNTLSDIYSTGVILYEMFTGSRPFNANSHNELRRLHKSEAAIPPRDRNSSIPELLGKIVMRCLEKSPEDRFPDFTELRQSLENVYDMVPVKKPFVSPRKIELPKEMQLSSQCFSMLTLKDFKEALRIGEELIKLKPHDAEVWNNTAIALVELGETEKSCTYLEKAVELNPNYVEALTNLGGALIELKRNTEARQHLEKAIEIDPNYAEAWANLGMCLAEIGHERRAFECFDRAVEANSKYWKVWLLRAQVCLDLNRAQEALDCCEQADKFLLSHPVLWELKARSLLQQEKLDRALVVCNEGLQHYPESVELWGIKIGALEALHGEDNILDHIEEAIRRFPDQAKFYLGRGLWFSHRGFHSEAEKSFARAAELNPQNVKAWQFRGEMLVGLERYKEAIPCYQKTVELQPKNSSGWQGLGISHLKLQRFTEALPALEKAEKLNPQDTNTQYALKVCRNYLKKTGGRPIKRESIEEALELTRRGLFAEAIEKSSQAIGEDLNNALAYQIRGGGYVQLQQFDKALNDLNRSIELNPQDSHSHVLLAKCLFGMRRSGDALAEARLAVKIKPYSFLACLVLGEVAQAAEDYEEAAEAYSNALEHLQKNLDKSETNRKHRELFSLLHRNYGICLKQLGDFESAFSQLQKALELNPGDQQARTELRDFE